MPPLINLLNDYFQLLVSTVTLMAFLWKRRRKTYAVEWSAKITSVYKSILEEIPESFRKKMVIGGARVDGLAKFMFVVRNTGSEAIDRNAIVRRFAWTGPGHIRAAWVDSVYPRDSVDLELCVSENVLKIGWPLLNPGCRATIGVLCEHNDSLDVGCVSGQIRNVPRIRVKSTRAPMIGSVKYRAFGAFVMYGVLLYCVHAITAIIRDVATSVYGGQSWVSVGVGYVTIAVFGTAVAWLVAMAVTRMLQVIRSAKMPRER